MFLFPDGRNNFAPIAAIFITTLSWKQTLTPFSVHPALQLFDISFAAEPSFQLVSAQQLLLKVDPWKTTINLTLKNPQLTERYCSLGSAAQTQTTYASTLHDTSSLGTRLPVKTTSFRASTCQRHSPWTSIPATEGAVSLYLRQREHLPLSMDNPLITVASKTVLLKGLHTAQFNTSHAPDPG